MYVVDDDESLCRALARLFRSVGLEAQTFPSARAFLDYTPPDRPACLVLDVRLPGPSGLDLQSALSRSGRDVPIVFITGHGSVPTSVRAMKGGAVDFLEKMKRESKAPAFEYQETLAYAYYGAKDWTRARQAFLEMELEGVRVSLRNLMGFPWVRERVESGRLTLHGAYFAIADGVLHVLDEATGTFAPA